MASRQELSRRMEQKDRTEQSTPMTDVRTSYGIRISIIDLWVGNNFHWVPREQARRFDFMTSAIACAISMGYDTQEFTVEAL